MQTTCPLKHGIWEAVPVLTDEFNGDTLDAGKWIDHNPNWSGRHPAFFSPGNVSVKDGMLRLAARVEDPPETLTEKGYHTYSTASVRSRDRVLYGYFEVRAKPMRSILANAFWFYCSDKSGCTPDEFDKLEDAKWSEIDVFEIKGDHPEYRQTVPIAVHCFFGPEFPGSRNWTAEEMHKLGRHDMNVWQAPFAPADDFHVYGMEWDREKIVFSVDGKAVWTVKNDLWHQPLHMLFDVETMDWDGLPPTASLPLYFEIDYVRAWRRKDDPLNKQVGHSCPDQLEG
jgi:beta-glucanase (GH16 family)